MGLISRILLPSSVKKVRRAAHPVSALTPRSVRKAKMGVVDATHPLGAAKRAGERAVVRSARSRGGGQASGSSGLVGALIAIALLLAAVVAVLSIPGHLLGLTPSVGQLFANHPPGYLHARYRNTGLGYLLTAALGMILLIAFARIRATRGDKRRNATGWSAAAVGAVALVALLTHTGVRSHMLSGAQAVGVDLTARQMRALDSVAQHAVGSYSDEQIDLTLDRGWLTIPMGCSFVSKSSGVLGDNYNFACGVDAFNARLHHASAFQASVQCASADPSGRECSSDGGTDVSRRRLATRAVPGSGPSSIETARIANQDLPVLSGASACSKPEPSPAPAAVAAAIDYDRLYQRYGGAPFRVVPGGPVRTLPTVIAEFARATHRCAPIVSTILAASVPSR